MGFRPTAEELAELIEEIDEDGSGAIEFPEFAQLCAKFLVEDPDPETMRAELKQAFRLFDKQGTVRRWNIPEVLGNDKFCPMFDKNFYHEFILLDILRAYIYIFLHGKKKF